MTLVTALTRFIFEGNLVKHNHFLEHFFFFAFVISAHCVLILLFVFQSPQDLDKEMSLAPQIDDINRLFAGETLEEIFAALEKEGSEWALKQLATLSKMVIFVSAVILFSRYIAPPLLSILELLFAN